jgi:hypothetical protein
MLPTAQAFAAGSTSSSTGYGSPVMMVQPAQTDDTTAGGAIGSHAGSGVMMLNPPADGAPPPNGTNGPISSNAGNGVMMLSPNGAPPPSSDGFTGGAGSTPASTASNGNTNESDIVNGQINLNSVWTNANITVDNVNGDVNGQATAVANAFQAVTMNNTIVNNNQYASGAAVGADLNASVTNINGSVNMNTQVACNTADVSTDPAYTIVNSKQECAVGDPSQATNVFAAQIQNNVNVSGSVAGNVYTEDTNAKYNYVNTQQINSSAVNSTTNVQAYNVGGTVNVSSSAVGNTAQVVHY